MTFLLSSLQNALFVLLIAYHLIGVEGSSDGLRKDFSVREIPASTWAVFTSVGPMPSAIQNVWERIYKEWFPATGYEHAGTAELEVYPEGDNGSDDYRCEVWIPVVKNCACR